ncbi:MAG: NADP oxidoreductase [Gemmatimonadetes bacterium]|nr:NADP oxidoreductase [Gemmatimonadota bacterium]
MPDILRVAVVGAGPAGFFLAEKLLGQAETPCEIDLYERLPAPYGLVRFGVAPDHEKIKAVTRSFDKVAARPGFRYFGNVEVGETVTLDELRQHYHALAFATGAQSDRRMGIPGEDLAGSHPATEFVAWYNGHPDFRDRRFNLAASRVAVVGVGNVAVDVARILARTPAELGRTDVADHALDALAASGVREVYLLGRRGPAQAAFTTPEVKELGEMEQADACTIPAEVTLDPLSAAQVEQDDDATVKRKIEVLQGFAAAPSGKPKRLTIRFLVSPIALLDDGTGAVGGIRLGHNRIVSGPRGLSAEPTGTTEDLPVELVFRSVGYKGLPIAGLPFDEKSGVVPNQAGRVAIPGIYVTGWIKRGPSGVIGTNKPDAAETAQCILDDFRAGRLLPPPSSAAQIIETTLRTRQADVVTWADWTAINATETTRGKAAGRPRVKCTSVSEMLAARTP